MDSQIRKKGKPLHPQAREVINNVYKYFVMEADLFKNTSDKNYFNRVHHRTSEATGVSLRTITRILNEADELLVGASSSASPSSVAGGPSPGRGRPIKPFCLNLTINHYGFIRRLVYDFHLKFKKEPNFEEIKKICTESIDYKGSSETIKRILDQMGFIHLHTEDQRTILVEKFEVRLKRIKYLREIENYRSMKKNIVYVSVLRFEIPKSHWQLTVMVAANEQGLVPGAAGFFEYDVGAIWSRWEKWLTKQLLPQLLKKSVLVMDSAAIHDKLVDPPPAPEATKQEMIAWLNAHEITVDPGLRKPQLYEHILQNKDIYSEYCADQLLAPHGHCVLRLPVYHAEFNPVQTIYCQLRVALAKQAGISNITQLKAYISIKLESITRPEWRRACERVQESENEFRVMERSIDEFIDKTSSMLGDSSDEESEYSD